MQIMLDLPKNVNSEISEWHITFL